MGPAAMRRSTSNRWNNINVNNRINIQRSQRQALVAQREQPPRRALPRQRDRPASRCCRTSGAAGRPRALPRPRLPIASAREQALQDRGISTRPRRAARRRSRPGCGSRRSSSTAARGRIGRRVSTAARCRTARRTSIAAQVQDRAQNVDRGAVQDRAQNIDRSAAQNRAQNVDRSAAAVPGAERRPQRGAGPCAEHPAFQGVNDRQARDEHQPRQCEPPARRSGTSVRRQTGPTDGGGGRRRARRSSGGGDGGAPAPAGAGARPVAGGGGGAARPQVSAAAALGRR
ncbi:MAG: hypothetical protein MZV49_09065 [Rhodopseudomonas palustris]|nr:hypothetical protein [Rhodopseudomonas palustris]